MRFQMDGNVERRCLMLYAARLVTLLENLVQGDICLLRDKNIANAVQMVKWFSLYER